MTDPIAPALAGQGTTAPSATPVPITSSAAPGIVPTAAPSTPSLEWLTGAPEDITGFVQNKGWKSPVDAIEGYRNLEKHMGVPADKLLRLPDWDKADKTELDQFFGKLGRPADPKGYEINVPDGTPADYADAARIKFHELGLTAKQAKALVDWNNEFATTAGAKSQEAYKQAVAQQDAELRKEWGQAYDQEIGSAKNAAAALGIKPEEIDKLEQSLGFAGLMKVMANIGKRIGEDTFVSGGGSNTGAMTPAGAKARVQQLQGDKEWTAKYLSGNIEARAEMERLMRFAYPS